MTECIVRRLRAALPRELLLDLADMTAARSLSAYKLAVDHTDLKGRGARSFEGIARFLLLERGFEDICSYHGGMAIEGGVMPDSDLRFFQPFMRFGGEGPGVVLALASMQSPKELPIQNKSRTAGISLNKHLTPELDLGVSSPKPGDLFVLFLVARDRDRAGMIQEMAIGVIDGKYEAYLRYDVLDELVAGYSSPEVRTDSEPASEESRQSLVRLKRVPAKYVPPEEGSIEMDVKKGQ